MEKNRIKIACLGDSITYGENLIHRALSCYPAQLQNMLGKGYEVRNYGRNGSGLWRKGFFPYTSTAEYQQALSYGADIHVICLGTNDVIYPDDGPFADVFVKDYDALIRTLKSHAPNAVVLLAQIPPIPCMFTEGKDGPILKINEVIARVAEKNCAVLIDLYKPFQNSKNLFTDGIHPNLEGAKRIAEVVNTVINMSKPGRP